MGSLQRREAVDREGILRWGGTPGTIRNVPCNPTEMPGTAWWAVPRGMVRPFLFTPTRSKTEAEYNLPSSVGSSVRSPAPLLVYAAALKSRLTKSAKGIAAL